jgi:sugar/nucleoside kinase (ribokinase family)
MSSALPNEPNSEHPTRSGILAGGNWIVDYVKLIDVFPQQDALASILSESSSNGGGAYNVLVDLAQLGAPFPLDSAGLVGDDDNGRAIVEDCRQRGIGTEALRVTREAATSYTDVMSVAGTGRRTFFHRRGANALLGSSHFDFDGTTAKIFHLAYLLLLDGLDAPNDTHGTVAAEVLQRAQAAGLQTSIDVVSEDSERFARIVLPALRHVNYAFLNEFEAARCTSLELRQDDKLNTSKLKAAARELLNAGVRDWLIVHFPEGAYALGPKGEHWQGSVQLPESQIAGAVGAGDAFAAGALFALHEEHGIEDALRYGVCAAAASLTNATASGGVRPLEECLQLGERHGYRTPL